MPPAASGRPGRGNSVAKAASTSPSRTRRAAEHALWSAIEDRRDQIRAAKLPFGERQHHKLRVAHDEGRLIEALCGAMENYRSSADEHNLRGMARTIRAGFPTWEEILIRPGEPWSPFVSPAARRGAKQSIADATAYIPLL